MSRRDKNKEFLLGVSFLLFSTSMTSIANAACTPTPDCASIGYTETSCETDYLACPFDSTKLKCIPCDSSFRYDCTDENTTKGIGNVCNGKYTSCICKDAQLTFHNGKCLCLTSDCLVGAIYYSDKTCSSCLHDDKNPIGVVVKNNELVMSIEKSAMKWSTDEVDLTELAPYTTTETAILDYNGQGNTSIIVEHYGSNASNNAGVYCYNYSPNSFDNSKNKWYLPAAGELYNYVWKNLSIVLPTYVNKIGWDSLIITLWTSTENNKQTAWIVVPEHGYVSSFDAKFNSFYVSCFLKI